MGHRADERDRQARQLRIGSMTSRPADVRRDQEATASRERDPQFTATHAGEAVTIRTVAVEVDPAELQALHRGEMPDGLQTQVDAQIAEDEALAARAVRQASGQ